MTYGFLPFAILPFIVSIDRLDDNLVEAAVTCTPAAGGHSCTSCCR